MKIGALGYIVGDLTDVNYNKVRWAAELGFHGLGAHLTVPAESISDRTIANARAAMADQGLAFLQVWPQYPCIITPDETVRRAGVAQARESVKLAAKLGIPGSGVRPTSLNPRGDWWPHPDNFKPETEDRFVRSMREILETADDCGVNYHPGDAPDDVAAGRQDRAPHHRASGLAARQGEHRPRQLRLRPANRARPYADGQRAL